MGTWTKTFSQLSRNDAPIAGGKGASLGEMTQAGIPVPPGYVVLSAAFEHFLTKTDLHAEIDSILAKVNHEAVHTVDAASEQIKELILSQKMPAEIQTEILSSFKTLGSAFVAVRSSATAEDGAAHAWAGQLESYLNTTSATLLENVKRCWASLFTPRAIFYRFEKKLNSTKISVAVVVQKMVQSEVSGIAFSVHPVTQDYNQLIIEAGFGLGEAIVSGQITPDSYVVEKDSRKIIENNVAIQERGLFKTKTGGCEWQPIASSEQEKQKLSDSQIQDFSQIVVGIEKHYGFPCDIEWAFEGGKFYIVQSRPITTLTPAIVDVKNDDKDSKNDENQVIRVTSEVKKKGPKAASKKKSSDAKESVAKAQKKNQKEFINKPAQALSDSISPPKFNLDLKEFEFEYTQRDRQPPLFADLWLTAFEDSFMDELGIKIAKPAYILTSKSSGYANISWKKQILEYIDTHNLYRKILNQADIRADEFIKSAPKSAALSPEQGWEQFLKINKTIVPSFYGPWYITEYNLLTNKIISGLQKYQSQIEKITDMQTALTVLISPTKKLVLQQEQELFNKLLNNPTEKLYEEYLTRFGWMTCYIILPGKPMTREDLDARLNKVRNAPKAESAHSAKIEDVKLREKLLSIITDKKVRKTIVLAQETGWLLTDSVDRFMHAYSFLQPLYRNIAKEIGVTHEDMIYFTIEEVTAALKGKPLPLSKLKDRKEGFVLFSDGKKRGLIDGVAGSELAHKIDTVTRGVDSNAKEVKGTGIYKGIVRGIARICKTPIESQKVGSNEILVTSMTSPDYLPAMKRASAFVTDEGGLLCHAAIISRELNKVCVVGTKIATLVFNDGDLIEVDATNGVVTKVEPQNQGTQNNKKNAKDNTSPSFVDGEEWVLTVTRNMSFWHQELSNYGHFFNTKDYGVNANVRFLQVSVHGTKTSVYVFPENHSAYVAAILERVSTLSKFDSLVQTYKKYSERLLNALSAANKSLTPKTFKLFLEEYQLFAAGLTIPLVVGRVGLEKLTQRLLEVGISQENIAHTISVITYPDEKTPFFVSQIDLLKIGEKIQKNKISTSTKELEISKWLDAYGYIPVNFCENPYTREYVDKELQRALTGNCAEQINILEINHNENSKNAEVLLKKINDAEVTRLSKTLAKTTSLNEFRKNIFCKVSLEFRPIFSEIASKLGSTSWRDCFYLTSEEMMQALNGSKLDIKKVIAERQEVCIYLDDKGKTKFLPKDHTHRLVETLVKKDPVSHESRELVSTKGFSANKGIVRGTARIIMTTADFHKFNRGDILVAVMTSVDFVPIMEKAAAFVTNEGGITSHASIVAREMNKPCVIGTKNATHIFHDGDLVEVDANNGVVRKISALVDAKSVDTKDEWIFMWSTTPILPSYWSACQAALERSDVYANTHIFSYFDGSVITTYVPQKDIDKHKADSKKYLKPEYYSQYLEKYKSEYKQWWTWIRNVENKNVSANNKSELIEYHKQFTTFARDSTAYFGSTRPEFTFAAEKELEEIVKKKYPDNYLEIIGILATAIEKDDIQKESLDWLKLVEIKFTDADLLKHASKYPWLVFGQFDDSKIIAFLRDKLKTTTSSYAAESNRIDNEKQKIKNEQEKIFKSLGKNIERVKYLANFLQTQSVERMNIKAYWAGGYYLTRNLWKEISKALKVRLVDLLSFVSPLEIDASLENSDSIKLQNIIADRSKAHGMETIGTKIVMHGSNQAISLFEKRIKAVDSKISSIKGQTAMVGKVVGKVRKVIAGDLDMLTNSIREFQKGEILVTAMTHPNMMSIAQKAAAIIADEGGITSHAAIISRELKIPCIVGCLHAMQALNDGDLVEVDANNGVVRKISATNENNTEVMSLVSRLAKIKWRYIHKRKRTPIYQGFIFESVAIKHKESASIPHIMNILCIDGDIGLSQIDFEKRQLQLADKLKNHGRFFHDFAEKAYAHNNEMELFARTVGAQKQSQVQHAEILRQWTQYIEQLSEFGVYVAVPVIMEPKLEEELQGAVKAKFGEDKASHVYQTLTTPTKLGVVQQEEENLIRIAIKLESGKQIANDVKDHVQNFAWLKNNKFEGIFATQEEILKRVEQISLQNPKLRLKQYLEKHAASKKEFTKYRESFNNNKRILSIIDTLQEAIFFRSWRTERYYRNAQFLMPFFERVAKDLGLSRTNDLFFLTGWEIKELLQSKLKANKALIEERKGGFAIVGLDEKITIFSGNELKPFVEQINLQGDITASSQLKGQTAFPGIASGPARVIHQISDLHKVKDGEILVSFSTTPDYVSILKKVRAIVTEEGGVLSHASVISRELHIPCVIGVKNVTKTLNDGDLIEVNATTGIVRKLDSPSQDEKSLSEKFLALMGDSELYPIVYNSAAFTFGSQYNTKKYFSPKVAKNIPPYHLLYVETAGKSMWNIPRAPIEYLTKIAFAEFMINNEKDFIREKKYNSFVPYVTETYKSLTPAKIKTMAEKEQLVVVQKVLDSIWTGNAWAHFSIIVDKDFCKSLCKENNIQITDSQIDEMWDKATHLVSPSFDVQQKMHMLELISKKISWKDIVIEGQYVFTSYNDVISLDETNKKLSAMYGQFTPQQAAAELLKIKNTYKHESESHNAWLKTLTPQQQKLAKYCQTVMRVRDVRKNFFNMGQTTMWRICEILFAKAGIDSKYIRYILLQEELLKGSAHLSKVKSQIESRAQGCSILVHFDGKLEVTTGAQLATADYNRIHDAYHKQTEYLVHDSEIKGHTAYPGRVTGIARVIMKITPQTELNSGEILVAGMTRPEYVHLMKQAAAIVTNEGGITCHAAIVSRELKKPCVIGTKVATRVIKDGDMIEVDATNGIVKILSKQKVNNHTQENKESYVSTYWCTGVSVIFTDLMKSMHTNKLTIVKCIGGKFEQCYPQSVFNEMQKEGISFYSSDKIYNNWKKEVRELFDSGKKEYDSIKSVKDISAEKTKEILTLLKRVMFAYGRLDLEYTDTAYTLIHTNLTLAKNLADAQKLKDPLREEMEYLFIGKDSLLGLITSSLSAKFKVPVSDLENYYAEEMLELFNRKRVSADKIAIRRTGIIFETKNNDIIRYEGQEALDKNKTYFATASHESELKGICVQQGKARGFVKIIRKSYDGNTKELLLMIATMKQGDILVCEATTPDLMPAIKKAAAIVTEVGGRMSHAAITSRELKIPCVVGVRFATKNLNDGDLIEVDATNGIVKRLERKN